MKTFLIIYGVIALIHALIFIWYLSTRYGIAMCRCARLELEKPKLVASVFIPGTILWPLYWILTALVYIIPSWNELRILGMYGVEMYLED